MKTTTNPRDRGSDHSEAALRWLLITLALVLLVAVAACSEERKAAGAIPDVTLEHTAAAAAAEVAPGPAAADARLQPGQTAIQAIAYGGGGATLDILAPPAPSPNRPESQETDIWVQYRTGVSAWRNGELDSAEARLSTFAGHFPDDARGRVSLARVLIEKGRVVDAVEHARAAEALDPGSGEAKRTLARARAEADDCATALALYEEALEIDSEDRWSLNNMGYLLIEHGRHGRAVGPLALAVALDSYNAVFRNNLGAALEGAGYTVAAFREYQAAAELDPDHVKAQNNMRRLSLMVHGEAVAEVDPHILASEFKEELVCNRGARERACHK